MVLLQMLGEVSDADREKSDLALGATGVVFALAVLLEDFGLLLLLTQKETASGNLRPRCALFVEKRCKVNTFPSNRKILN